MAASCANEEESRLRPESPEAFLCDARVDQMCKAHQSRGSSDTTTDRRPRACTARSCGYTHRTLEGSCEFWVLDSLVALLRLCSRNATLSCPRDIVGRMWYLESEHMLHTQGGKTGRIGGESLRA